MESPIVENSNPPQETSKIFGILGFVLSLMGLVLATILRKSIIGLIVVGVFLILGLIFSIIQRKKAKTGLSTAGLIISIIGIIYLIYLYVIISTMVYYFGVIFSTYCPIYPIFNFDQC